jgi:hypothetical protein
MERMMEQRVNANFCVELQKLPREMLEMLKTVCGESQTKKAVNVKV